MRITEFFLIVASVLMFLFGCGGGGAVGGGAISGKVIAPGDATAPIYVLAIKYENVGMVRKIETEKMPVLSKHVAGYARLDGPGDFTITNLEDGDYVLWGWMDMNANGAVEHLDFAEPVGWYQNGSNLGMKNKQNKLTIARGQRLESRDVTLYQPTPFPAADTKVTVGAGGGLLKSLKGNKVLVLWGTGPERAKAMGRLLAPQEAWNYWKSPGTVRVGGFNTAVSARYLGSTDYPSLTFETDSYGGAARDPVFMDPKDPFSILTTNTFYKYSGVNAGAVSQAGGYRSFLQADDYRYWAMLNKIDDFASKGKTIGTAEMIEILRAASRTKQYDGITEYSFIGYPDAMKFALAKEDLENKILEAS